MVLGFLILVSAMGCTTARQEALDNQLRTILRAHQISELDIGLEPSTELVVLGQVLFFDKVLSGNRDVSCATCHLPFAATTDGLSLSIGVGGVGLSTARTIGNGREFIPRNATEIFNRGSPDWSSMFWDSRVALSSNGSFISPAGVELPAGLDNVLAVQAMFPVTSEAEMLGIPGDMDVHGNLNDIVFLRNNLAIWDALMARLLSYPGYVSMFNAAYPETPVDELGFQHAANAIAAFEIEAWTFTDSPWDQYLAGSNDAMSNSEKRGAVLFYGKAGCASCHADNLMTDQQHHNIAAPQFGPGKGDGELGNLDFGRYRETGEPQDKFAFRTPPLRNVAITGPWMHNGAYTTLEAAVEHMLDPKNSLKDYNPSQLSPDLRDSIKEDLYEEIVKTLDILVSPTALTEMEFEDLLAFLHALTSPTALDLQGGIPLSVPSGLPIDH